MRYYIFTSILSAVCCALFSNCVYADSNRFALGEHCDTIVKTNHLVGGAFTPEDVADTPPRYVTIETGEIVDTAWFSMLKGIIDTTYKSINDVIRVDVYVCDWKMVKRFEEYRKKENPTLDDMWSLSRKILYPVVSIKKMRDDYIINTKKTDMWDVEGIDGYTMVMLDTIPLLIPKRFKGELYNPIGKITYKYTSNYLKYAADPILMLQEYFFVGTYFEVKKEGIERIGLNSTFMSILIE